MKVTIAKRLYGGFALVVALIVGVGGVALYSTSSSDKLIGSYSEKFIDSGRAGKMQSDLLMARLKLEHYLRKDNPEDAAEFAEWAKSMREGIDYATANFSDPQRKELSNEIDEQFAKFETVVTKFLDRVTLVKQIEKDKINPGFASIMDSVQAAIDASTEADEVKDVAHFRLAITRSQTAMGDMIELFHQEAVQEAQAKIAEANTDITSLVGKYRSGPLATNLKKAAATLETVSKDFTTMTEAQAEAIVALRDADTFGPAVRTLGTNLQESFVKTATQLNEESDAKMATTYAMTIGGVIAAVVIGIACALFIARSTVRPIRSLIDRLKDIAQGEGDLTQRVDEARPDELGELGRWFNLFVAKVHDVIVEVSLSASEVAAASTEIAASNEEMAAAVEEVSAQTSQATGTASTAGRVAEEGGKVVQDTVRGIMSLNEAATSSADCVSDLFKRSEQIGDVIAVIRDIADQTNLLALNAAIEAARAGEHGRGFAVVADEVRKLAERTGTATEEVSKSITDIQTKTTEAVELMNRSKSLADEGSQSANQAGERLTTIVTSAREVATLIEQISSATTEVGASVAQSATASTQLSTKAEGLRSLVLQFKVQPRSAGRATEKANAKQAAGAKETVGA